MTEARIQGTVGDPDAVAAASSKQQPAWTSGEQPGYHGLSLGWYESERLRRVDPRKRTIGQNFRDEFAGPLGVAFHIGLPAEIPPAAPHDEVLHINICFSLGHIKPSEAIRFGSSERAYGTPGAGGSFGFVDPEAELRYAYGMNRLGFHLSFDLREMAVRQAMYDCLGRRQL